VNGRSGAFDVAAARPSAVLEDLDFCHGEPFELARLDGGLTNRNYRVITTSGREFVARFAGPKSELLSIDRDAEAYNSAVAASLGVGPRVVEYAPNAQVLVVEWIDGRTFTEGDLDDPLTLSRIAATCRTLHGGPRFISDFDMFDVQRGYLRIVRERGFRLPADYLDFETEIRRLDDVLHASSAGTVACHNDLLAANIMDSDGTVWFIDYEYSGNNDPCFELGNIWSEAELPDDRLEHLIAAYHGRPAPVQTARARLFALMSQYGWTLWASIQDAVSDVDFDFWTWGMAKYERATALLRSTELQRLIDTVEESPGKGPEPWPQSN
jgi:thiamine kinase-like enzyme